MKEKGFMTYLTKNNVSQEKVESFISRLNEFNKYLEKKDLTVDSIPNGGILNYTEYLIENKGKLDRIPVPPPRGAGGLSAEETCRNSPSLREPISFT